MWILYCVKLEIGNKLLFMDISIWRDLFLSDGKFPIDVYNE